jgi:hypothetical protein
MMKTDKLPPIHPGKILREGKKRLRVPCDDVFFNWRQRFAEDCFGTKEEADLERALHFSN